MCIVQNNKKNVTVSKSKPSFLDINDSYLFLFLTRYQVQQQMPIEAGANTRIVGTREIRTRQRYYIKKDREMDLP